MRWHFFDKHVLAAGVVILWVMCIALADVSNSMFFELSFKAKYNTVDSWFMVSTVESWFSKLFGDAPKSLLNREFLLYLLYQDSTVVFFSFSLFKLSCESFLAQNSFVYLSLYCCYTSDLYLSYQLFSSLAIHGHPDFVV